MSFSYDSNAEGGTGSSAMISLCSVSFNIAMKGLWVRGFTSPTADRSKMLKLTGYPLSAE